MFDENNLTHNVSFGETFDVQGWGANEQGYQQSTLQHTTMDYKVPMYNHSVLHEYSDSSDAIMGEITCLDTAESYCTAHYSDYFSLYRNDETASLALSGDSGTPVVLNGKFLGVTSTVSTYYQTNQFAFFDYHKQSLIDAINDIAFPTSAGKEVTSGSTEAFTISIPVQNFKNYTIDVNPTVTASSNSAIVPLALDSDCPATLASGEGCTITMSINQSQQAINSTVTGTIALGDDVDTQINVSIDVESTSSSDSEYGEYYSEYDETGGSSGGSTGLFSLIFMCAAFIGRKCSK